MSSTHKSQKPCGVAYALSNAKPVRTSQSLFDLRGRVAVVTGGQRGIGLEIALALAESGAQVYCVEIIPQPSKEWLRVQKFVSDLPDLTVEGPGGVKKGRLEYVCCDVTDQKATWDLFEKIAIKEGRLDICFANAGVLAAVDVLDYSGDDFHNVMKVNVNGALFTAQAAARQMVKHNTAGSIVFTASISGSIANKGMHWTAYNTSKAAVLQLTRSMASELGPKNIRVNSFSPGYIYTDMTKTFLSDKPDLEKEWCSQNPLGRLGTPDELRGVALFLASDASSFCTGSNLLVDGGHLAW